MIYKIIPPKRRSVRVADLKLFMLLLGLITLSLQAGAQCLQPQPQNHYSRVISSSNLNSGTFIQTDYDASGDHIYVPSTYGSSTAFPVNAYLTSINGQGYMDYGWGKHYPMTGNERCMATKVTANGDIAMAGITLGQNLNQVIFVMMVRSDGLFLWAEYFDQQSMDVDYRVLITETSSKHHIVVAASSVSSDKHVLIRLHHSGSLVYYDHFSVYAGTNPDQNFAVINAITPTHDDGYILVGTTGEYNSDFYAATAFKYDANFGGFTNPTRNWEQTYRHQLTGPPPVYDLNNPGMRSSTVAKGVLEDPGSDKDIVVVGYQGDHDQNFNGASYQNGFIWVLDNSSGAPKCIFNYSLGGNAFVSFNGIALDFSLTSYTYIITGSLADPSGNSQTILTNLEIDPVGLTSTVFWAKSYGGSYKNEGLQVYNKSGLAYLSAGLSDENSPGTPQPHVIAVDGNGDMQPGSMPGIDCPTTLTFSVFNDVNDPPFLFYAGHGSCQITDIFGSAIYHCETMVQPCGPLCMQMPATSYYSRVLTAHIHQDMLKADFDANNADVYIPSNYNGGSSTTSDPMYSKVHPQSPVEFSSRYSGTGNEKTRAIKYLGNDVFLAGTTINGSGNNVLYLMRADAATGTPIWYNYYDQNNTDVTYNKIVMTITTNFDIVVAASSGTGNNRHILLRVDLAGNMIYYEDRPLVLNGSSNRYYPFINDIEATADDGYVVVGSSGHNFDYCAAIAIKYDQGFVGTHTLDWSYTFRRTLAAYDFNDPNKRSSSEAQGLTIDQNGNIFIVGSTSDAGAGAFTATWSRGIIIKLDPAGNELFKNVYYQSYSNFLVSFNDVILDGINDDIVITGDVFDPNHWWYHTLVAKFELSGAYYQPVWGYMYGSFGMNRGFSIFKSSPQVGYLSVGVTNFVSPDFYTSQVGLAVVVQNGWGATVPHVLSVDINGQTDNDCYEFIWFGAETIQSNSPTLTVGDYSSANSISAGISGQPTCVFMTETCVSPFYIPPYLQNQPKENMLTPENQDNPSEKSLDIEQLDEQGNKVTLYPNPATDQVKLEISSDVEGTAQILIQDITGKTLSVRNVTLTNGENHFDLDISGLAPGTYLIHVSGINLKTSFQVTRVQKY